MGTYVYRIKAKGRKIGDGSVIHEAVFAYKPYGFDHKTNERWYKRYVGPADRAWNRKPDAERRNVLASLGAPAKGEAVFEIEYCHGSFSDDRPEVGFLWERDGKLFVYRYARANELVARRTGFSSMADMLASHEGYRPSCDVSDPEMREIADLYDAMQERRMDKRRAYRYGVPSDAAPAADDDGWPEGDPIMEVHLAMKGAGLL